MSNVYPRISEKSFALSQTRNTYIFNVDLDMNRSMVAEMVAKEYSVEVEKVNISVAKGKAVKFYTLKSRRATHGTRSDVKKAYVRLKAGQTIPIFAALTEEEKNESTSINEPPKAKRSLLNRKVKSTSSGGASIQAPRTQAKVGEK